MSVVPNLSVSNSPYIRFLLFGIFLQVVPCLAQSHVLKFDKGIGVGWRTGDYQGWMSFVAFSADGKMVASDGPADADDTSGELTLWNFGDGRRIKRLHAKPPDISRNWKYYATDQGVAELETVKAPISLGKKTYAVHAFSRDSRYVAESIRTRSGNKNSYKIHVVELATGKQVSEFGHYAPLSIAVGPDGSTLAAGYWD